MGDLNSDWVLYASILSVVFASVSLIAFAWKAFRGIEGLEKDSNKK